MEVFNNPSTKRIEMINSTINILLTCTLSYVFGYIFMLLLTIN